MSLGFLDHMRVVPDHRIPGMVTYPLDEVLLAKLVGVVCGATTGRGWRKSRRGVGVAARLSAVRKRHRDGADVAQGVFRLLDTQALQRLRRLGGLLGRRSPRGDRSGRQDAARLEDVAGRKRRAASGFGLRHPGGARARPTRGRREVQRDHGDPGAPRHAHPQGRDRVDRRHGRSEGDRRAHRRQGRALRARAQRQPGRPARGRGAVFRRSGFGGKLRARAGHRRRPRPGASTRRPAAKASKPAITSPPSNPIPRPFSPQPAPIGASRAFTGRWT